MIVKSGSGGGGTGGGGGGMGRRQSSARVNYGANRDGGGVAGGGTPHAGGDDWSRGACSFVCVIYSPSPDALRRRLNSC